MSNLYVTRLDISIRVRNWAWRLNRYERLGYLRADELELKRAAAQALEALADKMQARE